MAERDGVASRLGYQLFIALNKETNPVRTLPPDA